MLQNTNTAPVTYTSRDITKSNKEQDSKLPARGSNDHPKFTSEKDPYEDLEALQAQQQAQLEAKKKSNLKVQGRTTTIDSNDDIESIDRKFKPYVNQDNLTQE